MNWNSHQTTETALWSGTDRRGERVPHRAPSCPEVSGPPLLANAGPWGGAGEITGKWAMGIRLRWVLQRFTFRRTRPETITVVNATFKPRLKWYSLHVVDNCSRLEFNKEKQLLLFICVLGRLRFQGCRWPRPSLFCRNTAASSKMCRCYTVNRWEDQISVYIISSFCHCHTTSACLIIPM